jgi:hypothetical protein
METLLSYILRRLVCSCTLHCGYRAAEHTEQQQNESNRVRTEAGLVNVVKATPDSLFSKATSLCGFCTKWVEYKNKFGLKSNPYVHGRIKKQPKRYPEAFGDGMVVFNLGYELEHLSIESWKVMREANVLK